MMWDNSPQKLKGCFLFLPLFGHCGLCLGWFLSQPCVLKGPFYSPCCVQELWCLFPLSPLLRRHPKGAAGIWLSLSHLLFLYFAPYIQGSLNWQLLCPFPGGNPAKLMMLVGVPFIAGKCQTKYLGSAIGWRMWLYIIIYGGGRR